MVFKSYINGAFVNGNNGVMDVINPGNEELAGQVSLIDETQATEALIAAQEGFKTWSALSLNERQVWMEKLSAGIEGKKDEFLELLMLETGKLYSAALGDYQMLIDCLTFFIEEAKRMEDEIIPDPSGETTSIITREPLGVVVAYLAWNFPLLNVGYKLGPVLASGCSCILSPSNSTPLATLKIAEVLDEINFPKGVINIVQGDITKISHVFNSSDIPQLITLIGSTATGKKVIGDSLTTIKRFSLELGGNAPALVLKDYDEEKAAETLTNLKFGNCGQVCVSPNRVYVHRDQYKGFLTKAKEIAKSLVPGTSIGPLITPGSRQRMLEIIDDALLKGARIITGGKVPGKNKKGYYLEPTIISNVTPEMRCYREEIFGPIMPVIKYDDSTDLIEAGNDTEYGLVGYIFSNNAVEIKRLAKGLQFGTICVNKPKFSVELPHGGIKESGIGKDCSKYSLEEYYYIKRISLTL